MVYGNHNTLLASKPVCVVCYTQIAFDERYRRRCHILGYYDDTVYILSYYNDNYTFWVPTSSARL